MDTSFEFAKYPIDYSQVIKELQLIIDAIDEGADQWGNSDLRSYLKGLQSAVGSMNDNSERHVAVSKMGTPNVIADLLTRALHLD